MYVPRQAQKSHFIKNIYLEEAENNDLFSHQAQAFSTFHPHSKFSFEKLDLSCRNVIKVCMMNRPTDMSTFVLDSLRRNGSFSFPYLQNLLTIFDCYENWHTKNKAMANIFGLHF